MQARFTHRLTEVMHGDVKNYFLSFTLRMLGFNIFLIFVPAYLHNQGYSYAGIGLFFVIWSAVHAASALIIGRLAHTKGLRWLFNKGLFIGVAFLSLLPLLGKHPGLFVPLAVLGGLSGGLFWIPYHLFLAMRTKKGTRGTTIGVLWIFTGVATMIAPAIGGVLTQGAGASVALIAAASIMATSLIPLYRTGEVRTRAPATPAKVLGTKRAKGYLSAGTANGAAATLWPFAFYLLLGGYAALGIVAFATSLLSMTVSMMVGVRYDRKESRKLLKTGTSAQAITLASRLAATTPLLGIILDAVDKVVQKLFWLGVDSESYRQNDHDAGAIIKREFWLQAGIMSLFVVFAATESFSTTFLVAAAGSLLTMLI